MINVAATNNANSCRLILLCGFVIDRSSSPCRRGPSVSFEGRWVAASAGMTECLCARQVAVTSSIAKNRSTDGLREQIIEEEMQLRDPTHAATAATIDRNDRLDRELDVLARPDDSRIHRACGATRSAIERRRHREFDHGD